MASTVSIWLSLITVYVMWTVTGNGLAPVSSQAQGYQQCHYTLSINSSMPLHQAVSSILSKRSTGSGCVRIEVHSGRHALTSQILFPSEVGEIEFVGLESDVYVSCAYDVRSNYTWYFDHLSSVTISSLHFENCPRPLRLDTITNITIQNCSFW